MDEELTVLEPDLENVESEEDFASGLRDFQNLSLTASDWTTETLYGQINKGNIDFQPSFQRREVWSISKKAAFIESLILGIPVPQIVLAQKRSGRGKYLVLDGKQRLLSVLGFYNGDYALKGVDLLKEISGLTYDGLDDEWRDALDNATIRAVRLSGWNSDSVLYTIFHRLNTGSVSLNTQELRSALNPGPFTDFAAEFTSIDLSFARLFSASADRADFRMRDMELFTRYCGITLHPELFGGNLKEFLDNVTETMNRLDDDALYNASATDATAIIELYGSFYAEISSVEDRSVPPFSLVQNGKTPRFNRAVFDALAFSAQDARVREEMIANWSRVAELLRCLLENPQFVNACSLSTKTRSSLVRRVDMWSTALSGAIDVPVKSLRMDQGGIVSVYELS